MILKRSIKSALSVFLLICFAAVTLPLDFLHNHAEEEVVCKDARVGACTHKVHLSTKKASCWLCAFHLDKTFTSNSQSEPSGESPLVRFLVENKVAGFVFEKLLTLLRGPPSL